MPSVSRPCLPEVRKDPGGRIQGGALVQTAGEGTLEEEAAAGAEVLRSNKVWCVWGLGLGCDEASLER